MKILLLTQTSPLDDNRVLKCHNVASLEATSVLTVGIERGKATETLDGFKKVKVFSKPIIETALRAIKNLRRTKILIRFIIYFEIYIKMFFISLKFWPKIIHANDWYVLPLAVVIKKICRSKILYDAHELESEANGVSSEMRILIKFVERILWRHVDIFVTVSPSIAAWYEKEYGFKKTYLILNSPEIAPRHQSKKEEDYFREKFRIKSDSTIFLYMGAFEIGRGIERLIKIFEALDEKASIIFMGSGSLEGYIKASCEANNNMYLHSPVPHDQITKIACSANYGFCLIENVSLSDYYCLPNKFFDYIFSDIPVIASNFPDMREIIEKYDVGYCATDTDSELKNLISSLNVNKINKTSPHLINLVELGWEAQAAKLNSAYLELVS